MTATLDWVKRIEEAVYRLQEKPQFGVLPPFPWEALGQALAKTFSRPSLTLQSIGQGWMENEKAMGGIATNHLAIKFYLSPISVPLYFSINERDLKWLFANLSGGNEEEAFAIEKDDGQGFFTFLAISLFSHIEKLKWLPNLSFQIDTTPFSIEKELEGVNSFVFDLNAVVEEKSLWGRLFITSEFRAAFKRHFALFEAQELPLENQQFPVDLSVEIGSSSMSFEEFKKAKVGDFILLDRALFDMETKKGRVKLSLGRYPLFRWKIEEGGIRLLKFPQYEEVMGMEENEEEGGEDTFFEEFEEDEEKNEEELSEEKEEGKKEGIAKEEEFGKEASEIEEEKEDFGEEKKIHISPEEIPVELTVELARIQMKASDLMHLVPGDLLELNVYPEAGVNLMIHGKKVGKGELVKMEDMLFVRVLEL